MCLCQMRPRHWPRQTLACWFCNPEALRLRHSYYVVTRTDDVEYGTDRKAAFGAIFAAQCQRQRASLCVTREWTGSDGYTHYRTSVIAEV